MYIVTPTPITHPHNTYAHTCTQSIVCWMVRVKPQAKLHPLRASCQFLLPVKEEFKGHSTSTVGNNSLSNLTCTTHLPHPLTPSHTHTHTHTHTPHTHAHTPHTHTHTHLIPRVCLDLGELEFCVVGVHLSYLLLGGCAQHLDDLHQLVHSAVPGEDGLTQ